MKLNSSLNIFVYNSLMIDRIYFIASSIILGNIGK